MRWQLKRIRWRSCVGLFWLSCLGISYSALASTAMQRHSAPVAGMQLPLVGSAAGSTRAGNAGGMVGHLSTWQPGPLAIGSGMPSAAGAALTLSRPLMAGRTINASAAIAGDDHLTQLGFDTGGLTVLFGTAEGRTRPAAEHALAAVPGNLFHGQVLTDYQASMAAARIGSGASPGVGVGQVRIVSDGRDRRDARFLSLDTRHAVLTVMDFQRADQRVGRGLDLRFAVADTRVGVSRLVSSHGAQWESLTADWAVARLGGRLGVQLERRRNPAFTVADDTRVRLTFSRRFGRPCCNGLAADADDAAAPAEAQRRYGLIAAAAGGALLGMAAVSSGSEQSDGAERFPSQNRAARAALVDINPRSVAENREYGGSVYLNQDRSYSWAGHVAGDATSIAFNPHALVPDGTRATAAYHTHGATMAGFLNEFFSRQDIIFFNFYQVDGYLGTPQGRMFLYDLRSNSTAQFFDAGGSPFVLPN